MRVTSWPFGILFFGCLLIASAMATEPADDLTRNKSLQTLLKKKQFERNRVVHFLKRGDEKVPLLVSLPDNEKLKAYPVLYVLLDGDRKYLSGLEFAHNRGDNNVVFVGLPSSHRIRDFSSELSAESKDSINEDTRNLLNKGPLKGSEFSTYLAKTIMPFLEKEYGPFSIKILVGGSLGGISVLDTMLTYPQSFDAYAALSPSLWYNFAYYEKKLVNLAQSPELLSRKCLLITASEDEPSIYTNARKFDKLLLALALPQSFRYKYKRLEELQHGQAIQLAYLFVPPFVFNGAEAVTSYSFANLGLDEFQAKLNSIVATKTCFSHPTVELTLELYKNFGTTLVKEKRYDDAFALYETIKKEAPHRTLSILAKDSFLFPVFDKLTRIQKDSLAKDYITFYNEGLKNTPHSIVHSDNYELAKHIVDEKLGIPPHQPLRNTR